jgi:hypothetical protein
MSGRVTTHTPSERAVDSLTSASGNGIVWTLTLLMYLADGSVENWREDCMIAGE